MTGSAEITFDDDQPDAFSNSSFSGSAIISSTVNVSLAWLSSYGTTVDSYSFQTYIHEIGHALGLGHAGNYNGSASYVTTGGGAGHNQYLNDSWQASIMSYMNQSENTFINATYAYAYAYAYAVTPVIADILAIQSLYGITNANQRTGNTTYGDNSTAGGYLDTLAGLTNAMAITVLDDGGTDTFDFGSATQNQNIDMRAEMVSDIYGATGNLVIARGTVIENAIGGSGSDTIIGNDAANVITGGGGGDTLTGGAGSDVFVFGFGANNSSDTVTDYTFGSTNVATGEIAGDVIYFGGVSGVTVSQSGSDLVVNGVTLTGAASDNLIVAYRVSLTSVSYSSAAGLFAGGSEFADLTVEIYDFGTQESFDFITYTFDQNGELSAIDTTYDTSVRIVETFDSLSNETWETITRTYNAAGVLSETQTVYDNATSLLTAYDADNSVNWETVSASTTPRRFFYTPDRPPSRGLHALNALRTGFQYWIHFVAPDAEPRPQERHISSIANCFLLLAQCGSRQPAFRLMNKCGLCGVLQPVFYQIMPCKITTCSRHHCVYIAVGGAELTNNPQCILANRSNAKSVYQRVYDVPLMQ